MRQRIGAILQRTLIVMLMLAVLAPLAVAQTAPPAAPAEPALVFEALRVLQTSYVDPVDPVKVLNAAIEALRSQLSSAGAAAALGEIPPGLAEAEARAFFAEQFAVAAAAGTAVTPTQLAYAAIRGMTQSFKDSHTGFLTPQQNQERRSRQRGQAGFTGVGIILLPKDGRFYVWAVIPGGPAEAAGVRDYDRIARINDASTAGMQLEQVSGLIRGLPGTPVTLTLQRPGVAAPQVITITRGPIVVPSIFKSEVLDGGVGYIKLYQFVEGTSRDFRAALTRLMSQQMRALVLDLRGNGGGYLHELNAVMNTVLPSGVPVYTEMRQGGATRVVSTSGTPMLPEVVVGPSGTAADSLLRISPASGAVVIRDGTMLIAPSLLERIGARVEWDPQMQRIVVRRGNVTVEFQIGSRTAKVSGRQALMPAPAAIIGGQAMVPLRFVAEAVGARVYYNPQTRTSTIRATSARPSAVIPLPLYVLIDEGSASAAELLASAVQENGRGRLIGTKTAGAVEASIVVDLSDGSALSVTTFRLATGRGVRLENVGVMPDVEEALTTADIEAGQDRVLGIALRMARQVLALPGR